MNGRPATRAETTGPGAAALAGWLIVDGRRDGLRVEVSRTIDELVSSGREAGVHVAAYLAGRPIGEEQAAWPTRWPAARWPPTPRCTPSVSTGKGLTAAVVHVLAERGPLDYDLRIAEVWPEFRPARQGPDHPAARAHPHRGGTGPAGRYHRGGLHRLGADVRSGGGGRLEDAGLSALMAHAGANLPNFDAVAPPAVRPDATIGSRRDVLRADVPAVGTMTARAVVPMYAALLGPVDGVRLISAERLREVSAVAVRGPEWVFAREVAWGLGYTVDEDGSFGTAGTGGRLAFARTRARAGRCRRAQPARRGRRGPDGAAAGPRSGRGRPGTGPVRRLRPLGHLPCRSSSGRCVAPPCDRTDGDTDGSTNRRRWLIPRRDVETHPSGPSTPVRSGSENDAASASPACHSVISFE